MAKKIKVHKELTPEEKLAQEADEAKEAEQIAAGIQDEFQARGFELVEWVHKNEWAVLGMIAAVVLGGLGYGIWTVVDKSRNTDASVAYSAALQIWEAPLVDDADGADDKKKAYKDAAERNTAAREAFQNVVQKHAGTGGGTFASLYAGHAALRLNDADGAIASYRSFLDAVATDDPLRFAGYSGLAAAYDLKGDKKAAIGALEQQIALASIVDKDGALLTLARLYRDSGEEQKAKDALDRLVREFPDSTLKTRADDLLAGLAPAPDKAADKAGAAQATP